MMYVAQKAAETRANATPARLSDPPGTVPWLSARPRMATPVTASRTQARSRIRRDNAAERLSGPRNWMVTAVPRGSRVSAA
jgi:hypothetical protein